MALLTIEVNHNVKLSWAEPTGRLARIEQQLETIKTQMGNILETLDEAAVLMKAQTTAIGAMDVLVQSLSDTVAAAIKGSATLEEAEKKAVAILAVAKENSAALIAAANVNTPDETPADVAAVAEFDAAPPQKIDEPEAAPAE